MQPETAEQTQQPSQEELQKREALDFTRTKADIISYISQYIPHVTDEQINKWTQDRLLEGKVVNGNFLYFKQAAPNLFRVCDTCRTIKEAKEGKETKKELEDVRLQIAEISNPLHKRGLFNPVRMRVTYTITVLPDAVPSGEEIRCWLPFPHKGIPRQKNIKLLSVNSQSYYINNQKERTHAYVFMRKKAVAKRPTVFSEEFEYTSYAQYIPVDPSKVLPYDKSSPLYQQYTRESQPHLTLSSQIQQLATNIIGNEKNPYIQARLLFDYVDRFPWASAREYSTLKNIPEYVLQNKKGDCGQQTLLFIALCRSIGIPAHFQSGFMMHPNATNLHDWCEIYLNGYGWIPVDASFGKYPFAHNEAERYFYFGGIDNYRMVVNQNFSGQLDHKLDIRSETVDFQRGEVEWNGGNLYFDKWSWNIKISYK